ncbi:MAG: glycosyltransferase [Alphaproteobacteria bacterium]|nr:glycosyltransferase [Alphaproteobacteria bacterium]
MVKVSVIVPVYNTAKYLQCCLDSIIGQTLRDIEIVCVNDGSTDESLKILQEYMENDSRIKIISQKNQGLSAARNAGLKIASADYISFVDSDDFIHPEFLEQLYNAIQKTKCDVAGCDFAKIKKNKQLPFAWKIKTKIYKPAINVLLNKRNFIHFNVWNKLYSKECICDVPFIEGIYYEDWVFNTCVFAKIKSFVWIDAPLYGYRMSENSIMRSSYSLKKMNDYVVGIETVRNFFYRNYEQQWDMVKKTRIARTIKMMMNRAIRSNDVEILWQTKQILKELYARKIIGYNGLAWHNKLKFFRFLH